MHLITDNGTLISKRSCDSMQITEDSRPSVFGTCFWQKTLANQSSILQIFAHSKFQNHQTTDSKVMGKTFIKQKVDFLTITFESVVTGQVESKL